MSVSILVVDDDTRSLMAMQELLRAPGQSIVVASSGAAALKQMSGVKVVEEERIPETVQVAKTMESMINLDGAGILFPTSFGYFDPYILKAAEKYPKVTFEHAGETVF